MITYSLSPILVDLVTRGLTICASFSSTLLEHIDKRQEEGTHLAIFRTQDIQAGNNSQPNTRNTRRRYCHGFARY